MLPALAQGESDPAKLADLADPALRATPEPLQDALREAATLGILHREILGLFLARLELIETQIEILDRRTAAALAAYHDAVQRRSRLRPRHGR